MLAFPYVCRDFDGKVSPEEVAGAAMYLKNTLGKEGVQELISSLSKDRGQLIQSQREWEKCMGFVEICWLPNGVLLVRCSGIGGKKGKQQLMIIFMFHLFLRHLFSFLKDKMRLFNRPLYKSKATKLTALSCDKINFGVTKNAIILCMLCL